MSILWLWSNRKWLLPVLLAVAIVATGFYLIQHGKALERTQNVIQTQQDYIDTRQRVDNATQTVRGSSAATALEWLRDRQSDK